jgi:hypothetical protein
MPQTELLQTIMSSTKTNSEPDPASNNDDSNLSMHKRLESRNLEGVGAQFRRASKADLIARPADLDLDSDAEGFQVHQHSTGDQADGTQLVRTEGGSPSAARVEKHWYSKEDVALLIFHRDRGHNTEEQGGMCLYSSKPYVSASQSNPTQPIPARRPVVQYVMLHLR